MKIARILSPGPALAILLMGAFTIPVGAFQAGTSGWVPVDSSAFHDHLASLSAEEKVEQLRDWALIAASMDADPANKKPADTLFTLQPLRIDALHNLTQTRVGPVRWLPLANARILALIPDGTTDALPMLGRIADEFRVDSSAAPQEVLVYVYRLDDKTSDLSIRKDRVVAGSALYDQAAGYYEEDVRTIADLQKFLARNLDLVLFHEAGDHIRVGGRVLGSHPAQLIHADDLAVIFRAGAGLGDQVRAELERRGLRETYESKVNAIVSDFLKDKSSLLTTYSDFERLRQQIYKEVPYEDYLSRQVDAVLKANPPGLGFSLDPRTNFDQIAKDLRDAAAGNEAFFTKWLLPIEIEDIKLESKSYAKSFEEMLAKLSQLDHSTEKTGPDDRETSLAGLIGFAVEKANAPATAAVSPEHAQGLASEMSATEDVEDDARSTVDAIRKASKAKADELIRIANALVKKDITPLLDFKRYLEADIAGITIRAGAPKYRILDLQQMLKDNDMDVVVDGVYGPKTTALIRSFQEKSELKATGIVDVETWKALLKTSPEKADELGSLRELLQQLEEHQDYQCARYDGKFAGTEVGMTLYYTDLVMKLWGFANKAQTPLVPGFVPEAQYRIADIYKDDILHHPSTRGWLGGRLEAMGFHDAGATLHFAPVSTRLYNASSSYLFPGAEVPANFAAERFSSWWNNHYSEVADYEPQYHRLNQLMKWAAILEAKKDALPAPLAGLGTVAVASAGRFDQWWSRHKELKVPESVPFLKIASESTECIAIVTSEPFRAFGGLYSLSGGVTLPKNEELLAKLESDTKRPAVLDARELIPGADYSRVTVKDGETHIPTRNNGDFVRTGDSVTQTPPKEQRFEGQASSVAPGKVTTTYAMKPDGLAITASLGTAPLETVEVTRVAGGFRLSGEEAAPIAAARHLTSPSAGWTKVALSEDEFLLGSPSGRWTRVTSAKGDVGAGVRVDAGGPKDVLPVTAAELEKVVGDMKWLAIDDRNLLGDDIGARLAASLPDGARAIELTLNGHKVSAKLGESGIYIERGAGSFEQSMADFRNLASSFSAPDLLYAMEAGQRPEAALYARRTGKGDLMLAGFGGGGDGKVPPVPPAFFDDMIPPDGKFIRGILVSSDANAPLKVAEGLIELPMGASDEVRDRARRLSKVVEAKPEVGERIEKLASIGPDDLAFLEGRREVRGATYIEFKAVPAKAMGSTLLVDLQFTPEDPEIVIRQGDRIFTIPVAHAAEAIAARDFADSVAKGAESTATVTDLRAKSRPYFEVLESVRQATGGKRFLTKETAEVNAETVYRIGGGDPTVRFPRDISDVALSLEHADQKVALKVSESVVASTVALSDPKFPAAVKLAVLLDSVLARVEAPVTYEQFLSILDDDEKQITLIARYRDGGLVFSNRWVSLKEIAGDMRLIDPKDLLHLVTNGGQDVVDAFAGSGRFRRVILTRFTSGDQAGFEQALSKVSDIFGSFAVPMAVFSAGDWKELKADAGDAAPLLDAVGKADGNTMQADVTGLMAKGREQGVDWRSDLGRGLLLVMRSKLKTREQNDADTVIESVNASILASMQTASSRPARAAVQGVTQTKNE